VPLLDARSRRRPHHRPRPRTRRRRSRRPDFRTGRGAGVPWVAAFSTAGCKTSGGTGQSAAHRRPSPTSVGDRRSATSTSGMRTAAARRPGARWTRDPSGRSETAPPSAAGPRRRGPGPLD
jgi:hypothetical protein